MRRHAARIIALADARVIRFLAPAPLVVRDADTRRNTWSLDLPPAARELEVRMIWHLAPAIAGPGAAALRKLRLHYGVLTEWPQRLPCLVSLDLSSITVEAPFAPGACCPLLEELSLFSCQMRQARVDIRLPRLRFLDMDCRRRTARPIIHRGAVRGHHHRRAGADRAGDGLWGWSHHRLQVIHAAGAEAPPPVLAQPVL